MNLHGPVRAAETAEAGTVKVEVSLVGWPAGNVAATRHELTVLPAVPGPKLEPISPMLVRSLVHADRSASVPSVQFSPDGSKLLAAGYPSGVVQVWDVAAGKELRRFETPRGYRNTWNYAHVPIDWSRLYSQQLRRKVASEAKNGKTVRRIELSGEVRVWDLASGKELPALPVSPGRGASLAAVSPDGTRLLVMEEHSYDVGSQPPAGELRMHDLKAGTTKVVGRGWANGYYSRDGSVLVLAQSELDKKTMSVFAADPATGEQKTKLLERGEGILGWVQLSPDGKRVVVETRGGVKYEKVEILVIDVASGRSLPLEFSQPAPLLQLDLAPDGHRLAGVTPDGRLLVWDIATGKAILDRSLSDSGMVRLAQFTPDGKSLLVAIQPKGPGGEDLRRDPDVTQMTQPRLAFLNTTDWTEKRVLVCPQGYTTAVAFSPDGKTMAVGGLGAVHLFDLGR